MISLTDFFQSGLVSVSGNQVSRLPDFTSLSSQLAKATPSSVSAAAYSPTNTAARSCPATGSAWNASPTLPPTPSKQVCSCMLSSLSCVAKSSLNAKDIATLFGQVCGYNNGAYCSGISVSGATGVYGSYSACEPAEKLSFALNAYFQAQNNNPQACDFGGKAQTQQAARATGSCSSVLSAAGPSGTGIVSGAPGGGGSSSTATKKGAAGAVSTPSVEIGVVHLGIYVIGALLSGVFMILL